MLRASGNPETPWFFRYIPFANLYDLSIAFAFGAGFATLLLAHRKNFQILSAFSLPIAALILTLARFIGDEFIDLPPVLDSYWRPIHVGVASLKLRCRARLFCDCRNVSAQRQSKDRSDGDLVERVCDCGLCNDQ